MMARQRKRRKGLLRLGLWAVGLVGVVLAVGAGALSLLGMPTYEVPQPTVEVVATPRSVARGKRLVSMLCWRCHYDGATRGLSGRALTEISTRLGKVSAPNITRDPTAGIGGWSAAEVAVLLRTGIHPKTGRVVPPTVMPRWPGLADDDLLAILAYLQSDDPWVAPRSEEPPPTAYSLVAKYRALVGWSPLPYPRAAVEAPDPGALEAHGAYLVDRVLHCAACHSADWGEHDDQNPRNTPGYLAGGAATSDINGVVLRATNLTPHATGLGGWTSEQLRRALVEGFGPDDKVLRWPMQRYAGLQDHDVEAIYAYLQTLPPVDNAVEPSPPYRMIGRKADGGRHLYLYYGCHYCHGASGQGMADLRGAAARLTTDAQLVAFLKDPAKDDPLTPMPAWDGVIAEDEYPELCEYIRRLGKDDDGG
ncbi:MAG: c-type cytochrome [Myxococcales bacterium]|nr:c-type cytochrome [Myxococcales bacterium]